MDLSIYCNIAANSLSAYIALLAVPEFARYVRARNYRFVECFKQVIIDEDHVTYLFDGAKYMVKYLKDKFVVWYKNDVIHRDIFPAVVGTHGTMIWLQNGLIHRDNNKPAFINIWKDGLNDTQFYQDNKNLSNTYIINNFIALYQNGVLHSNTDIPTLSILFPFFNGGDYYYKHGLLHRDNDLPAVKKDDGTEIWYQNGKIHRDNNAPALIMRDYNKIKYYKHGIRYTPITN